MQKIWNVLEILNWSTSFIEKKNIEDAKYKIELLLAKVLELDRFQIYLNFDRPMSKLERESFKELLNRLVNNEPIQYILGKWDFYGYTFYVDKNVLIPRPETEELVEKVIECVKTIDSIDNINILDVGTGSGAIIVSLYNELKKELNEEEFNNINFMASDISKNALEIAKINAKTYNANINFIASNLFENINSEIDILISNPPYVSLEDYNKLKKEIFFEPKTAITDNKDGLYFYNELLKEVKDRNITKAFFEIGYNQKSELELICNKYKLLDFEIYKDLSNQNRILEITQKKD